MLSGNRNFEGRINSRTRANYLASPPLCIAYAIAGTVCIDMEKEPLGMRMWFRVCSIEYVELSFMYTYQCTNLC